MATTRLKDVVSKMKSKWTFGDKDFAYEFQINEAHNANYPYMMINPPDSEIPEIYGGWESYSFQIDFFDLYQTSVQKAVSLEHKWDNLEDLALEWFDTLMSSFKNPSGATVQIYFLEESLNLERVKEVANDRVIQIRMSFTLRAVTRCMLGSTPMNYYPNNIANLFIWLRADSEVVYSKSTKKVSEWNDVSGNNNKFTQAVDNKKPYRYTYLNPDYPDSGDFNEKTRLVFPPPAPPAPQPNLTQSNTNMFVGGSFTIFAAFHPRANVSADTETVFGI